MREQVLGRAGDGVGGLVDAGHAVVVGVNRYPVDMLARRVDRRAAPGIAGRAADPDLHRAGRAERVRAAVHSGQVVRPSLLSTLAMPARITHGMPYLRPVTLKIAR